MNTAIWFWMAAGKERLLPQEKKPPLLFRSETWQRRINRV